MKAFDLAAAKAGAPVCTRRGRPARILCTDFADKLPIVVAVYFAGDKTEYIVYHYNNGASTFSYADDLMMRDDDYAEKLARGEYAPSAKEKLTVENPTCKESLPVGNPVVKENLITNRECWRYKFAGQAMMGVFASDKSHTLLPVDAAKFAVICADALIAELEKTEK